jgi:periplasmic protein TonB
MKENLFKSMLEKKAPTRRWLFLPLSVISHALVVAVIFLGPLLDADSVRPELKVIDVFMAIPPAPAPKLPPRAGKSGGKRKPKKDSGKKLKDSKPVVQSSFVEPVVIPEDIKEDGLEGFDTGGGGVDGGLDYDEVGLDESEGVQPLLDSDFNQNNSAPLTVVRQPRVIRRVSPVYPAIARKAHVQGTVRIDAVTDIYGNVISAKVLSGHALLRAAALAAVKKWLYEPYMINGMPRPVKFIAEVYFKLNR